MRLFNITADFRKHIFKLYPGVVDNIELARHQTHIYKSVMKRLNEINKEKDNTLYISKFIAVYGLLPLFDMMTDDICVLWNNFCKHPEQLPLSFAAVQTCICK